MMKQVLSKFHIIYDLTYQSTIILEQQTATFSFCLYYTFSELIVVLFIFITYKTKIK